MTSRAPPSRPECSVSYEKCKHTHTHTTRTDTHTSSQQQKRQSDHCRGAECECLSCEETEGKGEKRVREMERVIVILAVLVLAQAAEEKTIISEKLVSDNQAKLECTGEKWKSLNGTILEINLHDDSFRTDTCMKKDGKSDADLYVKVRTAANLIEMDILTLSLIIGGNIVMYVLLGGVVYSLSSQPSAQRTFSGNKASDKQVLIQNGERDTYQQLNANKSEYSALGKRH
ncbi:T-cell surface glycoprotein CD3 gamma chain [Astyanax mexicanus]|uniref:T-cell surface glycoprotein CD3 gamma chain n=2 Tax=Astyanax mexicanus TaxID=7994 RepID=A0A8T2L5P2_ASTMX|nr:T-cell surface glycoprotein CD3 gamma chain [Astyanax mexicanus]